MYKILAVDDEPKNLKLIEAYLEDDDFEIITAANGKEGWNELTSGQNFDLVLLDRMMPEMNGMELLHKIKSDETLKSLPVIMPNSSC